MSIITHGSNLKLAPTLRHLTPGAGEGDPRLGLKAVADAGFTSVQLDATMPALRPRVLDRSARRDLSATLRRSGLAASGLDFFIPAEHYRDMQHIERATEAAHAALELAADLGRLPLSVNLPVTDADPQVISDLLSAADGLGVVIAVHHEAAPEDLVQWLAAHDEGLVGAGLDPAACSLRGMTRRKQHSASARD